MSMINTVIQTHARFTREVLQSLKLTPSKLSAIPSFIFLTFSFILLYEVIHQRTSHLTSLKKKFCRDLGFQWTYFYLLRIWLLIIRGTKVATNFIIDYWVEANLEANKSILFSPHFLRGMAFTFLLCLSFIPLALCVVKLLYKQSIPNFLMWVGEDPWLRSEIGISGHYLDRPAVVSTSKTEPKIKAYRARRSTSVEPICGKANSNVTLRTCKSMENAVVLKTVGYIPS